MEDYLYQLLMSSSRSPYSNRTHQPTLDVLMCDAVEPRSLVIRLVTSSAVANRKHASIEPELAETTSF